MLAKVPIADLVDRKSLLVKGSDSTTCEDTLLAVSVRGSVVRGNRMGPVISISEQH